MDDELYGILRENGYDHIVMGDELEHRIEVFIDGELSEDLSFDFNDMFGTAQVYDLVEAHVVRRFSYCTVKVNLIPGPKYNEDEPRWHWQDLNDGNLADVQRDIESLVPIVDQEAGGIIAYALGEEHADAIIKKLNGDNYGN